MKLNKLKTNDSSIKGIELWADIWIWQGWNCMQLKVRKQLWVQLKGIKKEGTKLKLAKSQIKKP
jgi:hypothetical protein